MENSNPRILTGVVTSDKADKTITVQIERKVKHPLYGKIIKRSTKVHAHDEENNASIGDVVTVKECKLFLKQKHGFLLMMTWLINLKPQRLLKLRK